jgi:lysozyme family protein
MSASSFDVALARLLAHEGGYSNHPADPGGPTKFGITLADYRRYLKPDGTAADVRAMRVEEAKAIYRERYWNALRCDELPAGLDYAVFDYGVNSGVSRSARALRQIVGLAKDGGIDAGVLAAVRGSDAARLTAALCDERLAFLQRLRTWPVFGRGWGRRVAEVRTASLALARGQPLRQPQPSKTLRRGAGGVVVGGGAAAGQAHASGAAPVVVVAILLAALLIAIAIFLVLRWRRRRVPPPPAIAQEPDAKGHSGITLSPVSASLLPPVNASPTREEVEPRQNQLSPTGTP